MRALKVLVVVMGILILAGVATLVVVIAGRLSHSGPAPRTFTAEPIALPAGARIETMAAGPDRLVLDLVLADGSRQLLIIDLATGRRLGTVLLQPEP